MLALALLLAVTAPSYIWVIHNQVGVIIIIIIISYVHASIGLGVDCNCA